MADEPNTLEISVAEDIKLKDVPPGQGTSFAEKEERLPPEEVEKRQKIMLEFTRLLSRYCDPHNKKSRWVKPEDVLRVIADGKDLVALCNLPRGRYSGISALTHSQIDNKDPLRFFVTPNGFVYINPVIVNHTKFSAPKTEACMSYPDNEMKTDVLRYNKITVTYQTLERDNDNKLDPVISKAITETLTGGMAHVFQHECGLLNGCNIYDADYDPIKSIGLGEGLPVDPSLWGKVKDFETDKE